MFTDRQFDNYAAAMRDVQSRNPDKSLENILTAFNLGLKRAPATIKSKLVQSGRSEWFSLAAMLWDGVTYILKIQAGAAAIGAVVGGIALSEVPVVGTATGAALGARLGMTLGSWYLAMVGLHSVTAIVGQISGAVSVEFERGINMAKRGDIDGGANEIAKAFARIIELVAGIIILLCFIKGGKAVIGKIKTNIPKNSKLLGALKGLQFPISDAHVYLRTTSLGQKMHQAAAAFRGTKGSEGWGYSMSEISALRQMSRNGKFHVIRTCNPGRTLVGKGVPLQGKGLEIKGKSFISGLHKGKVGVDAEDIARLKLNYHFEKLPQNSGYRLKLKQGKRGELNNHILERADYTSFGKDSGKMVLLDAAGRPHIPDMDRLVCMALDASAGRVSNPTLRDLARYGDDPEEIARFNAELNSYLGGNRINFEAVRHGYTSSSVTNGVPIWHASSNETLLIFAEGRVFEMTWNHFVLFCQTNKSMNLPQCFKFVAP